MLRLLCQFWSSSQVQIALPVEFCTTAWSQKPNTGFAIECSAGARYVPAECAISRVPYFRCLYFFFNSGVFSQVYYLSTNLKFGGCFLRHA